MKSLNKLVLALLFLILPACGGGTTGTGDSNNATFSGKVLTSTGSVISGAEITVTETGDSATSAEDGSFNLETQIEGDSATLLVETGDTQGEVAISGIENNSIINIEITVDVISGGIIVSAINIEPRPNPTPEPGNTPVTGMPIPGAPTATPKPGGNGKSVVQGTLLFSDNVPVRNADISLTVPGKSDKTGPQGRFSIEFPSFNGSTNLDIAYRNIRGQVLLSGFKKSTDVIVTLQLKLPFPSTTVTSSADPVINSTVRIEKQSTRPR